MNDTAGSNSNPLFFLLGAPDSEMAAIEALLYQHKLDFGYALSNGQRCHPGNAAKADNAIPEGHRLVVVECRHVRRNADIIIDHHAEGDPGFGRPPEEFMAASSLGQVITLLAGEGLSMWKRSDRDYTPSEACVRHIGLDCWIVSSGSVDPATGRPWFSVIPSKYVLTAAADHCLGAAYAGKCPGVAPSELRRHRVAEKATYQGVPEEVIETQIEDAKNIILDADRLSLGHTNEFGICIGCGNKVESTADDEAWDYCTCPSVADLRDHPGTIPQLPEAAAIAGMAFVAKGLPHPQDQRVKIIIQAASPEEVTAFMTWAAKQGLVDLYGDPARGFAGGYMLDRR